MHESSRGDARCAQRQSSLWQLHSQQERQERLYRDLAVLQQQTPCPQFHQDPHQDVALPTTQKLHRGSCPVPGQSCISYQTCPDCCCPAWDLAALWVSTAKPWFCEEKSPRQGACACTGGLQLPFVSATGSSQTPQGDCPHILARVSPKPLASLSQK